MNAPMYQYQPGPPPAEEAGGATASLVIGIIGILLCGLLSPIALFMGISAKRRIRESGGYLGGDGQATAGIVLGAIGVMFIVSAILSALLGLIIYLRSGQSLG